MKHFWEFAYVKVIIIMVVFVLPLNAIAIMQNNLSINMLLEHSRLTTRNLLDDCMSDINARMDNTQSLLWYFLDKDSDCIQMASQKKDCYEYQSAKNRFFYNLKTMGSMTNGSDGYFYYVQAVNDMLIYSSSQEGAGMMRIMREYIPKQMQESTVRGWHIAEINGKQCLVLTARLRNVVYGGWINLESISYELEKGIEYENYRLCFSEKKQNETDDTMVYVESGGKDLYLQAAIPKSEITGRVSDYQKVLWILSLVYLILIPVLYIFFRHLLLMPLGVINEAHRQFRKGNSDYRITVCASSAEYQEAYQSFNQMADTLRELRIEGYEKEISRQKMELRNLQLQIRPHFLLNTFNIIFSLAQRKENKMIQETVVYLSDYFRYIFRSGRELELFQKELGMIKGYIRTASIRYSGRVEADYEVDPELDFVRIPPLLIHNFVENAVKYGMRQKGILHIYIEAKYEYKMVMLIIRDDGKGMSQETLEQNQRMLAGELIPENEMKHYGLYNSLKRLKYFYGEEATITAESSLGEGTCFKIIFPYDLEVDDESFDSE